jgi:transposase
LDGILWIRRTGAAWRDLPEEFGKWNSVYRQFRRWTVLGVWDIILSALAVAQTGQDEVHMIDSTIVRAHQCAAGGKGGSLPTPSAVHEAAFPPKSICAPMGPACLSP